MAHRLAIIGFGKIAQDAHLPAIASNPRFNLVAVADPRCEPPNGVAAFRDHAAMLRSALDIDAVAICTPPAVRHVIAAAALAAGKHVLLEKPPAANPDELADLAARAQRQGRVLFAAWHSRYNAAVGHARNWLAGRTVTGLAITWKEDVRRWHPGQQWIWRDGGFGVFDPGINALSIVTHMLPAPLVVRDATLLFVAGAAAPIAATIDFVAPGAQRMHAVFDWRPTDTDIREIVVTTEDGHRLHLLDGGARLTLDCQPMVCEPAAEYPGVYAHFDALLRDGTSSIDDRPLQLVTDVLLSGQRHTI